MTEVESNECVVENGEITASIDDGSISLNISLESNEESTKLEDVAVPCEGPPAGESTIVNGIKSDNEEDDNLKRESPQPTYQKLKAPDSPTDDSGSHRVGGRARKSSMERLLEVSLNTADIEDPNCDVFNERRSSYSSQGSVGSADSDCSPGKQGGRKSSIYEQKQIEPPSISRGDIIAARTENLFKNYERDISIHEAKPMININDDNINMDRLKSSPGYISKSKVDVVREEKERELLEIKKQYQQRLIDEENERHESRNRKKESKLNTVDHGDEDGDVFLERQNSSSSHASISSSASVDEEGVATAPKRRTSVYDQKQIEAPASQKGNIIASRTENLFKQYEKDVTCIAAKPMINIREGVEDNSGNENIDMESSKMQFEQGSDSRPRSNSKTEVKVRKPLASHMNRYIALTKGESIQHSDSDDEQDEIDNSLYIDKHGGKIERSGGKIEIVKSSDSISSIKNRFGGGNTQWKKSEGETAPGEEVDATKVSSARNVFMEKGPQKVETSFNRPCSKKVRDPKELMEIRKKATYGDEEELPQDGLVQKSVVIDNEELDMSGKHHALNVYKNLEKKEDIEVELQKPKTKLISDGEAQATMEGIRSISSSTSEASDVNETANDLTVDTVSGYGSAAPCSPSSTLSEDYLSDHKDASPRGDLKDSSIIHCNGEATLDLEVKVEMNGHADMPPVSCQATEMTASEDGSVGLQFV